MSEPNASTPPATDDGIFAVEEDLQFEQAEYATPARPVRPAGSAIGRSPTPITRLEARSSCHLSRADRERRSRRLPARPGVQGVRLRDGGRNGRGGHHAIIRVTGHNIGLIAVLVGFMVGRAVQAGSGTAADC